MLLSDIYRSENELQLPVSVVALRLVDASEFHRAVDLYEQMVSSFYFLFSVSIDCHAYNIYR